jgi:hypothetical protein
MGRIGRATPTVVASLSSLVYVSAEPYCGLGESGCQPDGNQAAICVCFNLLFSCETDSTCSPWTFPSLLYADHCPYFRAHPKIVLSRIVKAFSCVICRLTVAVLCFIFFCVARCKTGGDGELQETSDGLGAPGSHHGRSKSSKSKSGSKHEPSKGKSKSGSKHESSKGKSKSSSKHESSKKDKKSSKSSKQKLLSDAERLI